MRAVHRLTVALTVVLLLMLAANLGVTGIDAQDATPVPSTPVAQTSTSGQPSTGEVTGAQQQLADKYAPIAMLRPRRDVRGEGSVSRPIIHSVPGPQREKICQ